MISFPGAIAELGIEPGLQTKVRDAVLERGLERERAVVEAQEDQP